MMDADFDDARLVRIVRIVARRKVRPGVDVEDLIQQGYLGLLTAPERFDPEACRWSTWVWQKAAKGMETYLETRQHALHFTQLEGDSPAREGPEPSPWLVDMLAVLTDEEAETVTLTCGMDGSPPRTCYAVAAMLTRGPSCPDSPQLRGAANTTRSRYLRGLAKLRCAIGSR